MLLLVLVAFAACCSAMRLPMTMRVDKTNIIITGGNRGIGFNCAKQLSTNIDYQIVLACRDKSKGQAAQQQINSNGNVEVMELDLADLGT